MFGLGLWEIALLLFFAVLLFGTRRTRRYLEKALRLRREFDRTKREWSGLFGRGGGSGRKRDP